ncbi:MAG TPA: hypothetical protein VEF89_19070 [Solirubrobacteraceae bacterium]|nr:hypothetical protein [Solirubrobacteraceae bacterium]
MPKPLIGLLLATVVFFALWIVALKPGSSTSGSSPDGLGQYQSAINKAHQAVATSNAANARLGAPVSTVYSPAPSTDKSAPATTAAVSKPAVKAPASKVTPAKPAANAPVAEVAANPVSPSAAAEVKALDNAVAGHKVVVVLFYNPAAADDQAMRQEVAAVPTHGGRVAKFTVPVSELTQFQAITAQVPVVTAPTLVVIDPTDQAAMLTGFASQLEINQRVADALAVK